MLEKNQVPHVEAFNGLIAKGDHGQWTWALAQMKNVKVKPNIGTWNALLTANTKVEYFENFATFNNSIIWQT